MKTFFQKRHIIKSFKNFHRRFCYKNNLSFFIQKACKCFGQPLMWTFTKRNWLWRKGMQNKRIQININISKVFHSCHSKRKSYKPKKRTKLQQKKELATKFKCKVTTKQKPKYTIKWNNPNKIKTWHQNRTLASN